MHVTRGAGGRPQFHAALPLTQDEVRRVHGDAVRRIERVLRSRGLLGDGFEFIEDGSDESESLLPFVQAASVQSRVALGPESGRPVQTLRDHAAAAASAHVPSAAPDSLCHESHGFSLHAATRVEHYDRDQLEKLCRYVARPALSQARLTVRGDGKVLWELRKPWRDGTRAFVFDPLHPRGDPAGALGRDHAASARASADLPWDAGAGVAAAR